MKRIIPPSGTTSFGHEGAVHFVVDDRGFVEAPNEAAVILVESHGWTWAETPEQESARLHAEAQEAKPGELKTDGPTIAEWAAAGYKVENYPPSGYVAKSSPEEIAAFAAAAAKKIEDDAIAAAAAKKIEDDAIAAAAAKKIEDDAIAAAAAAAKNGGKSGKK